MVMTNKRLKEFFPNFSEEIDELSRKTACGCSLCVWKFLKSKHPKLKLPKSVGKYEPWG